MTQAEAEDREGSEGTGTEHRAPGRREAPWLVRHEKLTVAVSSLLTAVLGGAVAVLSLPLWSGSGPAPPKPSATVFVPQDNTVGKTTDFAGNAENVPEGNVLWAFTQHTASGRYYPDYEPCAYQDEQWDCPSVRVGGEPGSDSRLVLTLVDAKGAVEIMKYVISVEYDDASGAWGLEHLPDHVTQLAVRRVTSVR